MRYRGEPLACTLTRDDVDEWTVTFTAATPVGVAAGQAVVFYDGEECLGGGTIRNTVR